MTTETKIILASKSPRRKEILEMLGLKFEIKVCNLPEKTDKIKPKDIVCDLARIKAENICSITSGDRVIIGSDTIVSVDDKILGKPKDLEDARQMINLLRGRFSGVLTGLYVIIIKNGEKKVVVDYDEAKVLFAPMTDKEVDFYVNTSEPYDKAGAYAIQGICSRFIEKVDGNFFSVMGLPIQKVYQILRDNDIIELE